jgi:hypothetical protein
MLPHVSPRRRSPGWPLSLLTTLLLGLLVATPAQAAIPPQEPGVTLRVYDLQTSLDRLCSLKTGQTPNVDKLNQYSRFRGRRLLPVRGDREHQHHHRGHPPVPAQQR